MQELVGLIRDVATSHPNTQPSDLARFVAKSTSEADLTDFYEAALVAIIPNVLRQVRNSAVDRVIRRESRSAKLEGIRSYWGEMLASQIVTPDGWKTMGDCTVADLDFAITMRLAKIDEINGKIADLKILQDHMLTHGVSTLREAPPLNP